MFETEDAVENGILCSMVLGEYKCASPLELTDLMDPIDLMDLMSLMHILDL